MIAGIVENSGATRFLNFSVVVHPDGTYGDRYEKVHRVPFGEYVPLRSLIAPFAGPALTQRDAVPGTGPAVVRTDHGTFGVVISWEVFFGDRAHAAIRDGGQILLNPTNGSTYTLTLVQTQQVAASRLRAIETGRWVVQVAPTGFSAVIDPSGKVLQRTGISEQRVLRAVGAPPRRADVLHADRRPADDRRGLRGPGRGLAARPPRAPRRAERPGIYLTEGSVLLKACPPMTSQDQPLRIALLAYRGKPHVGGQGIYTRHLTKALVDLGHHVEVLGGQPYPVLDERVPAHRAAQPRHLQRLLPHADAGHLGAQALAGLRRGRRVLDRHLPRAARLLAAGLGAPAHPHAATSTSSTTTSASATACSPSRRGLPGARHAPPPDHRRPRLEMEHAERRYKRLTLRRWYAFTRMQTAGRPADAARHHRVGELVRATSHATTSVDPTRMHIVPVGVDPELFRPLPDVAARPRPAHHHRLAPTSR